MGFYVFRTNKTSTLERLKCLFQNVHPDPSSTCGPYTPNEFDSDNEIDSVGFGGEGNHDTIGMVAIDANGNVASGTSTNGASFKVSGLVI
jgi:N4-(beta-N-acetylglucosaminyl)-L-asparaginase